jgi:hypothetical protein
VELGPPLPSLPPESATTRTPLAAPFISAARISAAVAVLPTAIEIGLVSASLAEGGLAPSTLAM